MTRTFGDRIFAIGFLLTFAALLFRHDLFPQKNPHGHWFWTGILGAVLTLTGLALKYSSKRS